MTTFVFLLHIFSCLFLCGLIWVIQIVHYPSFDYISEEKFVFFQQFHVKSISKIVLPMMLVELITGLILLIKNMHVLMIINLCLLFLTWGLTLFLSMPLHKKLLKGYNKKPINKLIITNWPRTFLWTLRGLILCFFIMNKMVGDL